MTKDYASQAGELSIYPNSGGEHFPVNDFPHKRKRGDVIRRAFT